LAGSPKVQTAHLELLVGVSGRLRRQEVSQIAGHSSTWKIDAITAAKSGVGVSIPCITCTLHLDLYHSSMLHSLVLLRQLQIVYLALAIRSISSTQFPGLSDGLWTADAGVASAGAPALRAPSSKSAAMSAEPHDDKKP
jgi:hypothetical protein